MAMPGLAQVLGLGAWLLYRFLNPKSKKARLLDAKERILQSPETPGSASQLAVIDGELLTVQRQIDNQA